MVKLEDISKQYGEQWAVNHISFEIESGEIVGFIGPNGAGKSTTMKMITGYLQATTGTISVNGLNTSEQALEIKKLIGYLPENNPLYQEMYVKEYLQYAAGFYGIKGKQARERANELIELVGLTREQHKKIGALSKGFKQRVGISQALIHDPEILILDEPTSGLDPNQIIEIRNLISSVGKEKTVMLSTHIMQEVEAICDRVIIIDQGEIKADETAKNISSQHASAMQTIQVELDDKVNKSLWEEIKEIKDVRALPNNTWLLATTSKEDIRPLIFKFAVAKSLTILSMTQKEKSLEEVFRDLTK